MHEKLIIFPHRQYIIGIYISLAFRRYAQIRCQCKGLSAIGKKCNSWHMHNRHSAARCSSATCKMQTCRHVERQWVKRGPKFADRKCGHVGKMQTVILQTKWLIVIVLKNHEITISTMHWLIWTKFGLVWNLKFQSGRWQNYKQLSFLHCFNGNFGGNISS